jgi:hypothetical protein
LYLKINKMQNNSRNKASKRGRGGAGVKNQRAISGVFDGLRSQERSGLDVELAENIYVGRVRRKLGNGRVEVEYAIKKREVIADRDGDVLEDKDSYQLQTGQAIIRGTFRGRSKRAVWIEVNSPVLVEDSGLGIMEIKALLTRDQLKDLAKEIYIHPVILSDQGTGAEGGDAFEFTNEADDDEGKLSDKDIDNI